ncbi:MAG: toll/interleukin-1 receptor domain-containing protein [Sphingopyxis sp.]|uniref:toll/interleukin-1 receptor domain-containing protein n=1 Tax=Sphingopyxis sp. TaxID=1908224 RepID=UPI003D6CDF05
MSIRLPPIGFWSYARQDDSVSGGKLSALRTLLMSELQQQYGRDPIKIFQDVSAIPPGAEWEHEITASLNKAAFFIPIITPAFLQSEWCCQEVHIFLEREAQLSREYSGSSLRRIFPIHYIDIDGIDCCDDRALTALQRLQWLDFRGHRFRDQQHEDVHLLLSELAASVRQLLHLKLERLPSPAEKAAADRARSVEEAAAIEAAEAERAEREREAEATAAALAKAEAEALQQAKAREAEERERIYAARLVREEELEAERLLQAERSAARRAQWQAARARLLRPVPIAILSAVLLLAIAIPSWSGRESDAASMSPSSNATAQAAGAARPIDPAIAALAGRWRSVDTPPAECARNTSTEILVIKVDEMGAVLMNGVTEKAAPDPSTDGWVRLGGGFFKAAGDELRVAASREYLAGAMQFTPCP